MPNPNELIAEILETVVNSLPIDPADQARLKERVADLHKHNRPAKKAAPTGKAPNASKKNKGPAPTKPSETVA